MANAERLENLICACALGDQRAFAELYQDTASRMLAVAYAVLQNRALAEEALQDSYTRIWYSAKDFRADLGQPLTWLTAIVRNRALDVRRQQSRSPSGWADGPTAEDLPDLEGRVDKSPELIDLLRCMKPMEPEQRKSLLMAYYYGYSHSQVAALLALPIGTIKTWIRRGAEKLRECLER